eukprot:scaffold121428_cov31-Tisochrysis_lutea.AAC.1
MVATGRLCGGALFISEAGRARFLRVQRGPPPPLSPTASGVCVGLHPCHRLRRQPLHVRGRRRPLRSGAWGALCEFFCLSDTNKGGWA